MTCQAWRLTAIDERLTTADRQCQAWRSMKHPAKLARRWRPGAATLCTTTPGDSLARTFGRKLRFASRAELTQERRRPVRPEMLPVAWIPRAPRPRSAIRDRLSGFVMGR